MRNISPLVGFITILTICIIGCKDKSNYQNTSVSNSKSTILDSVSKPSLSDEDSINESLSNSANAIETQLLSQTGGKIVRIKPNILKLFFRNGDSLEFVDTLLETDNDQQKKFSLVDYFEKTQECIIEHSEYEHCYWESISLNNGKSDTLISRPLKSKNGKLLLCFYRDIEAGFNTNGFQVWSFSDTGISKIYQIYPELWGPDSATWVNDSSIYFTRVSLKDNDLVYFKDSLIFRNGIWNTIFSDSIVN